jgi:hypothetical protein
LLNHLGGPWLPVSTTGQRKRPGCFIGFYREGGVPIPRGRRVGRRFGFQRSRLGSIKVKNRVLPAGVERV